MSWHHYPATSHAVPSGTAAPVHPARWRPLTLLAAFTVLTVGFLIAPLSADAATSGTLDLSPGTSDSASVTGASLTDVDASATFTVPSQRSTYLAVQLRSDSVTDGYRAKARIAGDGSVSVGFSRVSSSRETTLGAMVGTGLTVNTNQKIVLEGQVTGSDPVHLSVRAKVSGSSTPNWQQTYDDSSGSKIVDGGGVLLWSYLSRAAGSSVSVAFSGATVTDLSGDGSGDAGGTGGTGGGTGGTGGTGSTDDDTPDGVPSAPPAKICGNTTLLAGPATAPSGAISVPAGNNSSVDFGQPGKTYWFAPGVHTLGSGVYDQIEPGNGSTFVGGPGAIIDGQSKNAYAFTQHATNVTIKYLTIRNFVAPMNEGTVNHDSGVNWTMSYNTITKNGGAGVFLGAGNTASYNCLSNNSQYGFQGYGPDGGESNIVLDHNEISGNNTGDWESKQPGCGCTGGGKFWDVRNVKVTNNYVHDNLSVGLWADTNNNNFLFDGNWIENNQGQAIFWEISYNAAIRNNVILHNLTAQGPERISSADNFPDAAIYISESGGDSRLPYDLVGSATIDVSGNLVKNNYNGIALWENADRFCGSPANSSSDYCTLVSPSTVSLKTCTATNIAKAPYYSDCRWKTQNVKVHDNTFTMDRSTFANCSTSMCGRNAIFSNWGSYPSWSPYQADVIEKAITSGQGNVFSDNTYVGGWNFTWHDTGQLKSPAAWQATGQDAGSTFN